MGQNWVVALGVIGLILACSYLLHELYTRRLYYKIRLYIEVASADKVVSMPVVTWCPSQLPFQDKSREPH